MRAHPEQLGQQRRTLAIATRAAELKHKTPTKEEWEERGHAIRAEQFCGSASSREITVRHYLDPKTSGALVFDYEINLNGPQSPSLVVLRNGKIIKREAGIFKGRIATRLLSRTTRHDFVFKVFDGKREYPDPLLIEIILPPFDAWTAPPKTPKEKAKQTRDEWIAEQVAWLKKAGTWPADEKAQKELMSKIEAEAMTKFGEAE